MVERDDTPRRMDELLALQQELANVQSAKAGFKLSEPNVVEVVQKMVEMGLLEVLYTSNGKEYVTPKRLHEEVADEILAHGGRINITELPPILNVDLPHIERAVDQLLKKDGSLQLYQGDILASYYLDSLAEDVHQALQAAGRVTIGDLAMQYNFSSEFMSKLIEPRLGTLIDAKLSGDPTPNPNPDPNPSPTPDANTHHVPLTRTLSRQHAVHERVHRPARGARARRALCAHAPRLAAAARARARLLGGALLRDARRAARERPAARLAAGQDDLHTHAARACAAGLHR